MRKIALSLVTLASLAVTVAACSGGGNGPGSGAEPCCAAEGQTVPPESTFNAATTARYAKAFLLDTAQCVSLDSADLDVSSLVITEASDRARVEDDGSYTLELFPENDGIPLLGRELYVRIYDGGSDAARGIGVISAVLSTAGTIPVAPILFSEGRLGESTIEQAIYCFMQDNAELQNMHFVDIRSVITADLAEDFVPAPGARIALRDRMTDYRHVINSLVLAVNTAGGPTSVAGLLELRRDAERATDACKLGRLSHPLCSSPDTAEAYRYWFYVNSGRNYDIVWHPDLNDDVFHRLQALAEDLTARLGDVIDETTDPFQFAVYRQDQLLRLEIAERKLRVAYSCWGDLDGDLDGDGLCEGPMPTTALDTAVSSMRASIVSATTQADIQTAWAGFSDQVIADYETRGGYQGSTPFDTAVTSMRQQIDSMHIDFEFNDPTNDSATQTLSSVRADADGEGFNIDMNNSGSIGGVLFYANVNYVP